MQKIESQPLSRRELLQKALVGTAVVSWVGAVVGVAGIGNSEMGVANYRKQYPHQTEPLSDFQVAGKSGVQNELEIAAGVVPVGLAVCAGSVIARDRLSTSRHRVSTSNNSVK